MDETFIRERISQLAAESGKSEKQISRELGRPAGYIQALTSGKSMPSITMLFNSVSISKSVQEISSIRV